MGFITSRGRRFHVQVLGSGEPLIMIHGLVVGDLSSWYLTVAPRLSRRRRVLLYDLRGHGRSEGTGTGFRLSDMTSDLGAVLDAVPGFDGPVDLVGHSYGGAISILFALDHPDRSRRIVAVDAVLPPFRAAEVEAFFSPSAVGTFHPPAEPPGVGGERRRDRLRRRMLRLREGSSLYEDLAREPAIASDRLAALRRPVLCAYGRRSPFLEEGRKLADALDDARFVALDAGHLVYRERPRELARVIERFLDG